MPSRRMPLCQWKHQSPAALCPDEKTMEQWGIEDERVQLLWASASEGTVLAAAVTRMTEEVRALGPLRWGQKVLKDNGAAHAVLQEA